jgi:phosphoribosylamine--glycine ligase
VILASPGYPNSYPKGLPIFGLDQLSSEIIVFHAGTKSEHGNWRTNGGRVLGVSATSSTKANALKKVYDAIESISFQGMQYRKDIGQRKELRR